MRSEKEVLEEMKVLEDREKGLIEKMKNALKDGDTSRALDDLSQMMVLTSVLSFATWLIEKTELRFSTLMDIEEVTKRGMESGQPPEDVLEFAWNKIKDLGEKKN